MESNIFKIEINQNDLLVLDRALSARPYVEVFQLIEKIRQQVAHQSKEKINEQPNTLE